MASVCRCGLNFEELKTTVSVQTLADSNAVSTEGVYLFCPACGTRNLLDLRPYGFFQWKGAFYRWRSAPTKIELTARGGYRVRLGELTLDFPESLMAHDKFSVEQICYPAVPVFAELDKQPSAPLLPVRKDYLELVDLARGVKSERTSRGEYRFRFHLKVLEETVEIVRPVVPVQPDRPSPTGEDIFDGVHLVLWPRINYREWRRYFLRFGCEKSAAPALRDGSRDVRVYAHASPDLNQPADEREWLLMNTVALDNQTRYGCVESRPDWVAVEFESKLQNEVVGGGMWHIDDATESLPPDRVLPIGLDFGTSNTCLAWSPVADPELMPIESCDQFIIHGSDLPEVLDFADTWPPRQGFGRSKSLLPTEILTRQKLSELRSRAGDITRWRPVVDYSVPSGGVKVQYHEEDHVLADFKWKDMIADAEFEPYFKDLQQRYLEFVLLFALAELAARKAIGSALHINFSYPLAFEEHVYDDFVAVLDAATRAVSLQTGVKVGKEENPLDEARAAARYAADPGVRDSACLYVDIGGGSTDIALLKLREGERDIDRYTYICSFQYAGGALASALAKGGCLVPGSDLAQLRRKVREVGSLRELMNTESVFLSKKRNAIEGKSSFFYAYLRQFLARLLAAHIITGEWRSAGASTGASGGAASSSNGGSTAAGGPSGAVVERPEYRVLLYPLGNGWGYGSFIDSHYTDRFCERLTNETNEIIDEAIRREIVPVDTPRVFVGASTPEHPKSAVAFGVLIDAEQRGITKKDWTSRTILGWTTQVGRMQKVDWYQPIVADSADPPKGQAPVPPHSTLDCPPDEWPAFPSSLYTPHELDEGLNKTRRHLSKCSPGAGEKKWFVQSPFHVLLEKLFKPQLEKLS